MTENDYNKNEQSESPVNYSIGDNPNQDYTQNPDNRVEAEKNVESSSDTYAPSQKKPEQTIDPTTIAAMVILSIMISVFGVYVITQKFVEWMEYKFPVEETEAVTTVPEISSVPEVSSVPEISSVPKISSEIMQESEAESYYALIGTSQKLYYEVNTDNTVTITGVDNAEDLITIDIPEELNGYRVTAIGDFAFYQCKSLTSVTIPDGVTRIGNQSFENCSSLTVVTMPDYMEEIGSLAFFDCSGLEELTIPDGVTTIGLDVFDGCPNLTLTVYSGSYAESMAEIYGIPYKTE